MKVLTSSVDWTLSQEASKTCKSFHLQRMNNWNSIWGFLFTRIVGWSHDWSWKMNWQYHSRATSFCCWLLECITLKNDDSVVEEFKFKTPARWSTIASAPNAGNMFDWRGTMDSLLSPHMVFSFEIFLVSHLCWCNDMHWVVSSWPNGRILPYYYKSPSLGLLVVNNSSTVLLGCYHEYRIPDSAFGESCSWLVTRRSSDCKPWCRKTC